jgi:hypothetical protein
VVSLSEIMRKFDGFGFVILLRNICEMETRAKIVADLGDRDTRVHLEFFGMLQAAIKGLENTARHCKFISTLDRVNSGTQGNEPIGPFRLQILKGLTYQSAFHELKVLREAIESDINKHLFVEAQPEKAKVFEDLKNGKWAALIEKVSDIKADVQSAVECYALEQDTACVFHLMRVAEIGLRHIASKVGVRLTDKRKPMPVDYATWDKVINGIKSKITAAHEMPKGPRKNKKLQFYSDAADQCTYFRDMWRNDVAHARRRFNDAEAAGIMARVRDFIGLLANAII